MNSFILMFFAEDESNDYGLDYETPLTFVYETEQTKEKIEEDISALQTRIGIAYLDEATSLEEALNDAFVGFNYPFAGDLKYFCLNNCDSLHFNCSISPYRKIKKLVDEISTGDFNTMSIFNNYFVGRSSAVDLDALQDAFCSSKELQEKQNDFERTLQKEYNKIIGVEYEDKNSLFDWLYEKIQEEAIPVRLERDSEYIRAIKEYDDGENVEDAEFACNIVAVGAQYIVEHFSLKEREVENVSTPCNTFEEVYEELIHYLGL